MRVAVVGGGIAGVSVAYELAARADVVLIEQEAQLAHHTTGRSAAMYLQSYGGPTVRALTVASRPDFDRLAAELDAPPLLSPRGLLYVADDDTGGDLAALVTDHPGLVPVPPDEAVQRCGALRRSRVVAAAVDDTGMDIDVLAIHQAYVRGLRARGGEIRRSARWPVVDDGGFDLVVGAAGAWTDEVAVACGARPVGLRPLRRTAFTSPVPSDVGTWPLVCDAGERWYFKPEGEGQVLASPADETPSDPCDARPDEADVALAIERINEATTLGLRTVRSVWAGLRTFSPDRGPVVGSRTGEEGFCFFAGQGGYGIQMAPALARTGASLILDGVVPPDVGVTAADLSPARFDVSGGRER